MAAPHGAKRAMPSWLDWFAHRQLEVSVVPIFVILALNAGLPPRTSLRSLHPLHIPSINPTIHLENIPPKFLYISYVNPETGLCLKGADDVYLLVFWLLVWTAARETLMRYVWAPMARALGAKDERSVERFAEQGWLVAYYACSWAAGLYIVYNSPYRDFSSKGLYEGYPHFAIAPFTKFYYLVSIAFWLQQLVCLNIEKRRKDFYQMLAHHIVTIALVVASYATNFTRIGNAILVTMDFADIVFSSAKMLKYIGWQQTCDLFFVLFVVSWVVTRHGIYTYLCYTVIYRITDYIPHRWDPAAGYFLSRNVHYGFIAGLLGLQALLIIWVVAIVRVVYKVASGSEATDTRSDSEDDDELDEHEDDDTLTAATNAALETPDRALVTGLHTNGHRPEAELRRRQ